jgi:hypothetical protein
MNPWTPFRSLVEITSSQSPRAAMTGSDVLEPNSVRLAIDADTCGDPGVG